MSGLTGLAAGASQYLTFTLAGEAYGLEILRVQGIKGFSRVTPIPHAPPHVKGVLNLRGTVVPVVDMRLRFALPGAEYTKFSVIIVVTVGARVVGLLVDAVSDVLSVGGGDVGAAPDFGGGTDISFLTGIAKVGSRLVSLLDVDKLVPANG
ncbi:MAG: purine-binding chemotaxis protein CheW [Planctomycetes bacterium]|nr:purine-binding chemotaxis protein CheW [Planctomycetota bacterium]